MIGDWYVCVEDCCVDYEKQYDCSDFDQCELEFYFCELFYVDQVYCCDDVQCDECEDLLWYGCEWCLVMYVECDGGDVDDVGYCLVQEVYLVGDE